MPYAAWIYSLSTVGLMTSTRRVSRKLRLHRIQKALGSRDAWALTTLTRMILKPNAGSETPSKLLGIKMFFRGVQAVVRVAR